MVEALVGPRFLPLYAFMAYALFVRFRGLTVGQVRAAVPT
jgi:hypothetical protein